MKKIFAIAVAVMMVMALTVSAFAADIDLTKQRYWDESGDVTVGVSTALVAIDLPFEVKVGETVTVHVVGSSDADFRVWLSDIAQTTLGEDGNGNLVFASANGFTSGGFDLTFDVECVDRDGKGVDTATCILFKGSAPGTNLSNFKITSLTVSKEGEDAAAPAETEAAETEAAEPETTEAETTEPETVETSAETTTEETASAPSTGLALAVVPAVVALAAAVVTKKH